ncbi:hypothetical protein BZG36_05505 [Bifiguratus adelaidae]|uniref:Uncharacterized protein n=1 Tax=Bifiguratus adelaidae TaxID=1938954 RepID=A0A261XTJ7_9FUNG|nr:hypothetical protein BZG36_05505 [Bifiguratus adelaidae]
MALHRRRHQSSLEVVLDFSQPFSLTPAESHKARNLFNHLTEHYEPEQTTNKRYKPVTLIRTTYERVIAKDAFLNYFFLNIHEKLSSGKDIGSTPDPSRTLSFFHDLSSWDSTQKDEVALAINEFADYMIDNFFVPLRASSVKTPQSTPASLSAMHVSTPTGMTQRVSALRHSCLIRDHHRGEAKKRYEEEGDNCKDDDGKPLEDESSDQFQYLEVAHILPHSLTSIPTEDSDLSDSKKNVLQILNMFDPVIFTGERPTISPTNP